MNTPSALSEARLKLSHLQDDLENCREDSNCPDAEIEDILNKIEETRDLIAELEAEEAQ